MTKLFKIISIISILILPLTAFAQKQKSVKKMQDEHFDKQAELKKQADVEREQGLKRHQKIQAKSTQKQMKQTRKKSERYQKNKREPFLKRLFTK
jgi:Ni/Co efflux regulator RcnB